MELLQLRYFYESAKQESFAKTAEKYMVPTTSVSASVKRLESELGCKLFDRSANRITLNQHGKRLQQSLCAAFAEIDSAVDALSAPQNDTREIRMLVRAIRSTARPCPDPPSRPPTGIGADILFADYMERWLDIIKPSVAVPTIAA